MRNITRRAAALATALLLGTTACDQLLEVDIPGRVPVAELNNPALAPIMVTSALGEFECAYTKYVVTTSILTGEQIVSGLTIGSNVWGWRGDVELRATTGGDCGGGYGYYTVLQRARYLAEDASKRITAFPDAAVPGKTSMLAQLAAYAGYSYTLLGEGFCDMAIDEGPLMTKQQVWAKAETWFTTAIGLATAPADAAILNMSIVGRARVRLNLGQPAAAAADADLILPTTPPFVRNAVYSSVNTRRYNRVFEATNTRDLAVAVAYRGLTIGGAPDTRVQAVDGGVNGMDGVTRQWNQRKYLARQDAIAIASYDEAQLIIAEARAGTTAAFDAINRLRTRASLPPLTAGTVVDLPLVLEERRRELFLEGHRYNDMQRRSIPFPSGVNHKGQTYGNITCLPLPDVERLNNPNL